MPWATEAETLTLTGVSVDAGQLAQAQGVVELFAGITEANSTDLSASNDRMLRAAVAYQAAWTASQVDVTGRMEVSSVNQDGVSVTPGNGVDLVLAPLAKRALARLSWHRTRATVPVRAGCRVYPTQEAYAAAWLRDDTPEGWTPL